MGLYTVIGAAGFVGARLTRALNQAGHEVFTPARGDPALFERDLGRVFYCAGLTADYLARPFETVEAHVGLIARLLETARFDGLVYCSSTRLYDWSGPEAGAEDAPLSLTPSEPRHLYDLSKALGETLCLTQARGRGAVARLACVWDEAEDAPGFLPQWIARARRERVLTLESAPGHVRDYIHLDDTVAGLRAILDSGCGGIVNLASGENVSNGDLAAVFEDAGWTVGFTRDLARQAAPRCEVGRLRALGVHPAPVRRALAALLQRGDFA